MTTGAQERKTRIIATVGPAVADPNMLESLARAGMNVARLNFSHGDHSFFAKMIENLRAIERRLGRPIGILADVQGPKIRVGKLEGGQVELKTGGEVWITVEPMLGGVKNGRLVVPTIYKDFVKDVLPGHHVLLDDGLMEVVVEEKEKDLLRCRVINGGILKNNKGINVPEASFSSSSITEKDYDDILFCIEHGVDFIALSFVRSAQEVRHLKSFIENRGKKVQVISKIERREALDHLDSIIDASDGILVARGDLAVEVGNELVPVLQKRMIHKCNLRGKTVIVATQMLMSMVENPRPTRAEASDVANAVLDGADSLMLSNETAVGAYPVESIRMMNRIVVEMEQEVAPRYQPTAYDAWELDERTNTIMALLQSAVRLSTVMKARRVVVLTQSGQSALLVSKCRPNSPIVAVTASEVTYHQMALLWGVEAVLIPDMESLMSQTSVFEALGERLCASGYCFKGDKLVMTAGLPKLSHGSTNTIKVQMV